MTVRPASGAGPDLALASPEARHAMLAFVRALARQAATEDHERDRRAEQDRQQQP